jgi:hypothetical protein
VPRIYSSMQNREEENERERRSLLLSLLNSHPSAIQSLGGNPLVGLNHPSLFGGGFPSVSPYSASYNNIRQNSMHLPGGASRTEDQLSTQGLPMIFSGMSPPPGLGLPTISVPRDSSFGGGSGAVGMALGVQRRMADDSAQSVTPYFGQHNNTLQRMGLPGGTSRIEDQFSTQRLPISFSTTNPPPGFGLQATSIPRDGPFGRGSGTEGMVTGSKRTMTDYCADPPSPSSKRRKKATMTVNNTNEKPPGTAFMNQRLASLSDRVRNPNSDPGQLSPLEYADLMSRLLPKHGAFPMPNVRESSSQSSKPRYSLNQFSKLWDETNEETRREVLARRLEQTIVPRPPRNYSNSAHKIG